MAQAVGTGSWHRQSAQAVGHIPAQPVGEAPNAAGLLPSAGWPPAGWPPSAGWPGSKTNSKSAQTPKLRAFLFPNPTIQFPLPGILLLCPGTLLRWPAILLPVVRHSASGCPQFYLRCPGLCSHSTFYLPKGSLSPSLFCFSVPNVQYYVTKAHYYHIQANIPGTRAQKPRFCAREEGDWHRES